ncbi:hypothetical protein PHYSODRAFT_326724 [Phytophthora sojae]|uniref:Uncharacterized protein n=1 Tax=Phytophthora sojae (strain P6497) TaxID=1094619 RepID=G4YYR2_PHYSP|nr:hypothetical protein PHYSODRAFT_326724 [Phytophthora sojae]EGZ25740.1 hypothetical protein PHYSODRAFT_326724 [Phytophthora sojae]|eukprot:XP_009521028.1 hypothetical protein PHYSODRAFT_326724 [Phytophthora sojae]
MPRKHSWTTIFPAVTVLLALATTPSSAFSFKSLFDDSPASQSTSKVSAEASSNVDDSDSGSADLSNGSDIKPRQPLLDPEDWFLTEEEITASRGDVPRADMAVYTTGNKVTTYTVSNEYFNAVYDDLSKTTEGDRVLLNAWTTALIPFTASEEHGRLGQHYPRCGHITYQQKGWVDGHIRIHGPAAKDVASNFVARWNSKFLPCQNLKEHLLDFDNPPYEDIPQLDYISSNTTANLGNQSIQITRTFSCEYKHYKEFAPKGEVSLFKAHLKAIRNAKNFIYIEDQYFVFMPELLEALYLYQNVEPIRSKYPNKFKMYTTKAELDLCIHSKIVIIDDVLRIRKFVEMTGLSYKELDAMTFVEAADQFAVAATQDSTILAKNIVEHHDYFFAITNSMRKVSDPQDTCSFDSNKAV